MFQCCTYRLQKLIGTLTVIFNVLFCFVSNQKAFKLFVNDKLHVNLDSDDYAFSSMMKECLEIIGREVDK